MDWLIGLVRRMGFDYTVSGGEVHVVFSSGSAKWQSAFKAGEGRVLIYSVYPFEASAGQKPAELCNRINAVLANSCFYYEPRNGRIVVRSVASLTDGYYAFELFREARPEPLPRCALAVGHGFLRPCKRQNSCQYETS